MTVHAVLDPRHIPLHRPDACADSFQLPVQLSQLHVRLTEDAGLFLRVAREGCFELGGREDQTVDLLGEILDLLLRGLVLQRLLHHLVVVPVVDAPVVLIQAEQEARRSDR